MLKRSNRELAVESDHGLVINEVKMLEHVDYGAAG
jgi:hypothetical protein